MMLREYSLCPELCATHLEGDKEGSLSPQGANWLSVQVEGPAIFSQARKKTDPWSSKLLASIAWSHPDNSDCGFTQVVVQNLLKGKVMYEDNGAEMRGTGLTPHWKGKVSLLL